MDYEAVIMRKIDLFMKENVLKRYKPSEIHWWFSLSGGKDSFSMCHSIVQWYRLNGLKFSGTAFFVKQWENHVFESLKRQVDWMEVVEIDAVSATLKGTNYQDGDQAPCSQCSSVRKMVGDRYIGENRASGKINILAKGLHLSDTAISYLWRWAFFDSVEKYQIERKYQPFVRLSGDFFLAKPFCFVRERESQGYASIHKYFPVCCKCPACKNPSRRDIVEESLVEIYKENGRLKWEFDVPGMDGYLNTYFSGNRGYLENISLPGYAEKRDHINHKFYDFATTYYMEKILEKKVRFDFTSEKTLDHIAVESLMTKKKSVVEKPMPIPQLLKDPARMTEYEKRMTATMGPMWGCIGLRDCERKKIMKMQSNLLGLSFDKKWSQVNRLLNLFYKRGTVNEEEV